MVVRFLPPPEETPGGGADDRQNLAEVVQLRGQLHQRAWARPAAVSPGEGTNDDARNPGEAAAPDPAAVVVNLRERMRRVTQGGAKPGATSGTRSHADTPADGSGWEPAVVGDSESPQPELERGFAAVVAEPSAEEAYAAAKADAVRILARRARSSGEVRSQLLSMEYAPTLVEDVIAECEENLYLDDVSLARALTEKLRESKRASRSQIRIKLRERRLPDEAIEAALAELGAEEEISLLRAAAVQRAASLRDLDRPTAERRLLGFLARRGWSGEPATRAVRDALDGVSRSGGVRFR